VLLDEVFNTAYGEECHNLALVSVSYQHPWRFSLGHRLKLDIA
jgi:hypothetical protein